MHYLIGDLQGCCDALDRLLAEIGFSPSRDQVHLLGDLVNRGPASLRTLQRLMGLGAAATCLLGNHDLHRGQELGRVIVQHLGRAGAVLTGLHHHCQPRDRKSVV